MPSSGLKKLARVCAAAEPRLGRGHAPSRRGGLGPGACHFFNDTATTEIYTLSLHDALPISAWRAAGSATDRPFWRSSASSPSIRWRSEEHTSELQSLRHLVCRLLLEKK